jgi:hypothetical protein
VLTNFAAAVIFLYLFSETEPIDLKIYFLLLYENRPGYQAQLMERRKYDFHSTYFVLTFL